jgi:hypothetical protein
VEDQAYVGELISALVYLYAGFRLLRLASRSGELPERLLGLMFVVNGAALILYDIPIILSDESLWTPLTLAGRITYLPAPVILALFTRRVFRQEGVCAAWIPRATAILEIVGVGGSILNGDLEGYAVDSPWFWAEWTGYTLPCVWASVEAFLQYRSARRRLALGLCDPLVCNRFLLWGWFAAIQFLGWVGVIPQYIEYEHEGVFTPTWDVLLSAGEIISLALIGLVFFSPNVYRRWIGRAASARIAQR